MDTFHFVSFNKLEISLTTLQVGIVDVNITVPAYFPPAFNLFDELYIQSTSQCHVVRYYNILDFKKAFDSVPQELLYTQLLKRNINGRFLSLLKNIYIEKQCRKTIDPNCLSATRALDRETP